MELVSGVLLWLADVFGIKWVRQEASAFKRIGKAIIFVLVGLILIIGYFMIFG
jgi:hypothetical protein